MKTRNAAMAVLLLSTVWALPASAQVPQGALGSSHEGFTDDIPRTTSMLRAKNRELGIVAPVSGSTYRAIPMNRSSQREQALLEYMPVMDTSGNRLGTIIALDETARVAEVYMNDVGKSVAMPFDLLVPRGYQAQAMVSKQEALAMERVQNRAFAVAE